MSSKRICIDTEEARAFRQSLDQTTELVNLELQSLQSNFDQLCGAWQGAQRNDFESLLGDFVRQMQLCIVGFEEDKAALDLRIQRAEEIASVRIHW